MAIPGASPWLTGIFWIALMLPLYSYLLYPLVMISLGAMVERIRKAYGSGPMISSPESWPAVAIVVSAYNEEEHIGGLIANLRRLEYPGPRRLYLGSDGSSDRTAELLQAHAGLDVHVRLVAHNRGKASMLNELVADTHEPIIAFTDANTRLEPQALQRLVTLFRGPQVGAVCGELVLRPTKDGNNVDGLYWRIERLIKRGESALGGLLGANGGIYAIRRECFAPIPADTLVDDFCIAMRVAAGGRSVVYASQARALEDPPTRLRDEFGRRVRIGTGNYQAFFRHPEFLFATGVVTGFTYISHKVVRWFTPHLLLIALCANALLLQYPLYRVLWDVQLGGYALCLALYAASDRIMLPRLLRVPVFLVSMNVAFAVGFWQYLSGGYRGSWRRTSRA